MKRRTLLKTGGFAALGTLTLGVGPCSVTKDKAVRYTDIAIGYLKDIRPSATQIGGVQLLALIDKGIPALEKLKAALEKSDFPEAGNLFSTVTNILGQAATALMQLPESDRRDLIMGLLTLAQVTLRTVDLFIKSEAPSIADVPANVRAAGDRSALRKAFEATRF